MHTERGIEFTIILFLKALGETGMNTYSTLKDSYLMRCFSEVDLRDKESKLSDLYLKHLQVIVYAWLEHHAPFFIFTVATEGKHRIPAQQIVSYT